MLQYLHPSAPSFSYLAVLDLFEKEVSFLSCYQYSCWRKSEKMTEMLMLILSISPFYSEIFLYAFASCPLLKLFKDHSSDQNFRSVPDILYQSPKRCFCNVYKSVYSMSLSAQLFVWHVHLLPCPRKLIVSQKSVNFYSMSKRGNVCRNMQFRGVWEVLVYRTSRFRICWRKKNRDHFFFSTLMHYQRLQIYPGRKRVGFRQRLIRLVQPSKVPIVYFM